MVLAADRTSGTSNRTSDCREHCPMRYAVVSDLHANLQAWHAIYADATAQNVDRKLITGVTLFDVYEGTGIEPGKKSIAIAVTIQPREKTMTDDEIEALAKKIVAEVSKRTGGVLRT